MANDLTVGFVYHVEFFDGVTPQKGKFGICVSVSKEYFLLINTANRKHYDCIPIRLSEHPQLGEDRFISCSNVLTLNTGAKFVKKYEISPDCKKELIEKIRTSTVLTGEIKRLILSELDSAN